MADLYEAMKMVARSTMEHSDLCDLVIGYVVSLSPLEIKTADRIILKEQQLLLTSAVTEKTINVKHRHIDTELDQLSEKLIVRDGLKKDDGVLLLRVQHGQRYIILSKVVEL